MTDRIPPRDTLVFGDGWMGETRAGLRVNWRAGSVTITAGTSAVRFATDHDYDVTDRYDEDDGDESAFFSALTLREDRWRLAAYASLAMPLQRGFATRAGVRVDRFQGIATTLSPFAEVSYTASWWNARIQGSRSHQALASVRNEEALLASFLAYDLLVPVSKAPVPRNTEFSIGWEVRTGGSGSGWTPTRGAWPT